MGSDSQFDGWINTVKGLQYLYDFGWLRPQELGKLLWPTAQHATKYAERLGRTWEEKGYILLRSLPKHSGTAWVLAERGAEFLNCSIQPSPQARSGKDWGETFNGVWKEPNSWRHDLLAHGVMATFIARAQGNAKVIPERRIRREHRNVKKIPDGLLINSNGQVFWLEVENAPKKGKSKNDMAKALIQCANRNAPVLCGHKPTHGLIAYFPDATDSKGHKISHAQTVVEAIRRHATKDTSLQFLELELTGAGVKGYTERNETIESDVTTRKEARMAVYGWHLNPETEYPECYMAGISATYWQDAQAWRYELLDHRDPRPHHDRGSQHEPKLLVKGTARTIKECKRQLAEAWPADEEGIV